MKRILVNPYCLWTIVLVLVCVLFYSLCSPTKVNIIEHHTTDTLVVYKTDTIREYVPKYIKQRVVDTLRIYIKEPKDTVKLPRTQQHYATRDLYDAWVSGFDPKLDSIRVYPKTEYKTITSVHTKEIYPQVWKVYFGGGFQVISGDFAPKLSLTVVTPKRWAFEAEIGYYNKKPMGGISAHCKIFEK